MTLYLQYARNNMVGNISKQTRGFTIVEVVIVIVVIAILTGLVVFNVGNSRERGYFAKAQADLHNMGGAVRLYAEKYNAYPTDTGYSVPASLVEFLDATQGTDLVTGPWPNSNYDYDYWDVDGDTVKETITVALRFCPPNGDTVGSCKFPNFPWAASFNNYSSVYYCVKGYCRSSPFAALYTNPGYCVNCPGNTGVQYP